MAPHCKQNHHGQVWICLSRFVVDWFFSVLNSACYLFNSCITDLDWWLMWYFHNQSAILSSVQSCQLILNKKAVQREPAPPHRHKGPFSFHIMPVVWYASCYSLADIGTVVKKLWRRRQKLLWFAVIAKYLGLGWSRIWTWTEMSSLSERKPLLEKKKVGLSR